MIITKDYSGSRLDKFTSNVLNLPHSLTAKLLRKKDIRLNGKRAEISTRLQEGDVLEIPDFLKLTPKETRRGEGFISENALKDFQSRIIYECDDYLVLNKPSGLATQGGTGIKVSVDEYLFHINQEYRLVHRLDKETSGVLLIAKSRHSASKIGKDFENKNIEKIYIAITHGIPEKPEGIIEAKLKRQSFPDAGGISEIKEDGKESTTHYKVLETFGEYGKIELHLETGRMHQIRVHLASIGCLIVGDSKYGDVQSELALKIKPYMLLHAFRIKYDGKEVSAPIPSYFLDNISKFS